MKNCPNCHAEMEDNYQLCWNCNYSLTEQRIIEFSEFKKGTREINCLRCEVRLIYSGNFRFHEGFPSGIFGSSFEIFQNKESFDLYICPKCGKVEFFIPEPEQLSVNEES